MTLTKRVASTMLGVISVTNYGSLLRILWVSEDKCGKKIDESIFHNEHHQPVMI